MIHPLVRLLASEPHLLTEHLGAYASLIGREAQDAKQQWVLRAVLSGLALGCMVIAITLAGVALMLWAVLPGLSEPALWVLGGVPALPALISLGSLGWLRARSDKGVFTAVQAQVSSDLQMLKSVSTS